MIVNNQVFRLLRESVFRSLCGVLFFIGIRSASAQLATSAWPDYGGGYENQHRSQYVGPSNTPQIRWAFDLQTIPTGVFNRGYHQPILLPDGTIVLNTADSGKDQIVALNKNGTLRWDVNESTLGPWLAADQLGHIYTIRDTYSSTNSVRLRSVDFNGNSLWQTKLPGSGPTQNGPAIGRDGNVSAAADFSNFGAFTPAGVAKWSSGVSGYYVNPAIANDGTIIDGGTSLTAHAPDGTILWQYPSIATEYLSPAIGDDGTIYAGQINHSNLVALTPNGIPKWTRPDLDGTPAIGTNGDIYVVPESGILTALSPNDGSTLWTYATGKTDYYNSEGVTVDATGNLYVSNDQGFLMSLTPNGNLRWRIDLAPDRDGFIGPSAPVIGSDGVLYVVGGLTGKVFALSVPEPSTWSITSSAAILAFSFLFTRQRRRRPRKAVDCWRDSGVAFSDHLS